MGSSKYEAVIGLEVHVELKTESKIFCKCSTKFGSVPNSQVCPVCLAFPGSLPVFNRQVADYAIQVGLALNSEILPLSRFERKNYYYPDLAKSYQISQLELPIVWGGFLEIETGAGTRKIRMNRAHMEEDAGKLVHSGGSIARGGSTGVDYNRAGVPLLEIVSEPDLHTAEEAKAFLEVLKEMLQYLGVSDCKMEEGSLRCDANVSVRLIGEEKLGTKAEIKNLNSFKMVQKGIEYEIARQISALEKGEKIIQETRSWDDEKGVTVSLRSKEESHDYRYFPDPDLPPLHIEREWVERLRKELPELPSARRSRLVSETGLSDYDARIITSTKSMADYFDELVDLKVEAGDAVKWITGEVLRLLNADGIEMEKSPVSAGQLAELIQLQNSGTISGKIAKVVIEEMWKTQKSAATIIEEQGLVQISDDGPIREAAQEAINEFPQSVEDYHSGKEKAIGFLVGQVMRKTKGRANPELVNQILKELLGSN